MKEPARKTRVPGQWGQLVGVILSFFAQVASWLSLTTDLVFCDFHRHSTVAVDAVIITIVSAWRCQTTVGARCGGRDRVSFLPCTLYRVDDGGVETLLRRY